MEARELLFLTRKEPFEPFIVILESGTRVPVNHPEEIFFLPNPAKVEDILVYSGEHRFMFGPSAVTAVRHERAGAS